MSDICGVRKRQKTLGFEIDLFFDLAIEGVALLASHGLHYLFLSSSTGWRFGGVQDTPFHHGVETLLQQ